MNDTEEEEISYVIQQKDNDGEYDITRPSDSIEELFRIARQKGIKNLSSNQRIVKRINIPLFFRRINEARVGD